MRQVLLCAALATVLVAIAIQAHANPFQDSPLFDVELEVWDSSDRPCLGPSAPEPRAGVEVILTRGRFIRRATTARNGRAVLSVPAGDYEVSWIFGTRSDVAADNYTVTGDQFNTFSIPDKTPAALYDVGLNVTESAGGGQLVAGDDLRLTVAVVRVDEDEATYVPGGTVVVQHSAPEMRGQRVVVAEQQVPPLCGSVSGEMFFEIPGLSEGSHTIRVRTDHVNDNRPGNNLVDLHADVEPLPVRMVEVAMPELVANGGQSHQTLPGGESITYTVEVSNTGNMDVPDGRVRLHLPTFLDFVSADGGAGMQCTADAAPNLLGLPIHCAGALNAGQSTYIQVVGALSVTAGANNLLRFYARVDPDYVVVEADENNNQVILDAYTATAEPVTYKVPVEVFASHAIENGYTFEWSADTSGVSCTFNAPGSAELLPKVSSGEVRCHFFFFHSTPVGSLRLAPGWTIKSMPYSYDDQYGLTVTEFDPRQLGTDNPYFALEAAVNASSVPCSPTGMCNLLFVQLEGQVELLGPPGMVWTECFR